MASTRFLRRLQDKHWPQVREVVGGRLINGYSTADMVLALLYRCVQSASLH
jgi:hypothetical protein